MNENGTRSGWRPRFSIQTLLMLILLLATLFGWYSSSQRVETQLREQEVRLRYAVEELERSRDELRDRDRRLEDKTRVLWQTNFDGAQLSGATIASLSNAFQRASFNDCQLENATLEGGTSAFQLAKFDRAKLTNAKLTGGGASFQAATFVDADLKGAVLTGAGSSFQGASFENANLAQAKLVGSFQSVNISGAHLEGADLSALDSDSIGSCYFKDPPTYDDQTKFPADFDPVAKLWKRISR